MSDTPNNLAAYIWSLADLLRGDFKQSQYGRIILPFTLLRRLECVLEGSKESVLAEYEKVQQMNLPEEAQEKLLLRATGGLSFFNISKMDLSKLGESGIKDNLESYLQGFSKDAREIFEHFKFSEFIGQLSDANLLYKIVQKVRLTDLSPDSISNHEMGLVFEELIRRFAEGSNETAGEHFTPRDIVRLTTSLVFLEDDDALTREGIIRTIYDPTAGTGGFLSSGMEYVHELNPKAVMRAFGQELNSEAYAICKAGMLIKGQDVSNIKLGNTLSNDQLYGNKFDYMLSHPPFGMNWKNIQSGIKDEHTIKGFDGRFGAGLPGVSDSSLLFLMHLISKLRDETQGGGRIGIILNGSPLVSGGAGSGESEIRRYILEADLLETIISLPTDMFYNTGIATYIWVLSNKKAEERRGKVQLINGVNFYRKMRKSTGSKRNEISEECVSGIIESHGNCEEDVSRIIESHENFEEDVAGISKIFNTSDFGYRRITIEHPLRLRFSVNAESLNSYKSIEGVKYIEAFTAIEHGNIFDSLESFLKAANVTELSDSTTNSIINCFANRHSDGEPVINSDGDILPDVKLRRYEDVPLNQGIYDYFSREISPSTPDAWIDESKRDKNDGEVGVVGYEINFQRIKMNTQMERLETQYKNYTVTNLGRLAQEFNRVSLDESFEERENAIYISRAGITKVASSLNHLKGKHGRYIQVVLNSDVISEYIESFFKSALGKLALQSAMTGNSINTLRTSELDKVAIALPDLDEQKNIVTTLSKLATLKDAIDHFDDDLALNPTSSKAVLAQLDDMLNTIGSLSEADEIRGLVREGETERVEFKSTLNLDLRTNTKAEHIATSAYKTVVAFLNSNGGTLLIGIADNGEILGVLYEVDKFHKGNLDKFLLHWKNKLKARVGEQYYPFIEVKLVSLDDKYVLRVDCIESPTPCYLDNKDFYVRTNPATDKLEGPKLVEYVSNHFKT